MVEDGGGRWRKATPWQVAAHTSTNLHQLPPSSTPSCSPAHLHLNHAPIITDLRSLFPEHFVVRDHLEVVTAPEVLHAGEISRLPVAGDAIARVELLHATDELDVAWHRHVGAQRVPAARVDAGSPIVFVDVFGTRGGSPGSVHALRIDARTVRVPLKRTADVEPFHGRDQG